MKSELKRAKAKKCLKLAYEKLEESEEEYFKTQVSVLERNLSFIFGQKIIIQAQKEYREGNKNLLIKFKESV